MDGLKDCVPFRAEQSPQLDLFADIPTCVEQTDSIYKIPLMYHEQGLDIRILKHFNMLDGAPEPDMSKWKNIVLENYLRRSAKTALLINASGK